MSRPVRIAFATNSDAGQYNIHLAAIHSLLEHHHADVESHLLAQAPGRKRCPMDVEFHEMPGMSNVAAINAISPLQETEETCGQATASQPPGFFGALKVIPLIPAIISPWQPSEYISITHAIEDVLIKIKPDLVVIDDVLFQAADAADKLEVPYIILSPSAWKDMASHEQGLKTFMLPLMGSGWTYPLPVHIIPFNFILVLYFIYNISTNPQLKAVFAAQGSRVHPVILPHTRHTPPLHGSPPPRVPHISA
ncbi:uncharacterized protein MKK02DRAFT_39632 [Dioszegia hungarica]|uniref:Uncharacterized protein n=1 Tax=Dioszegia hungarica TaxID=4972 RepID=A0AA38HEW0_9TREE|nr:uncharacterized protein MKK02DRAFT_39632 [Dioszegia hungarica]KAI9639333.1 hypothetical protein MKK02DRAFT_39632 [Dioszegia hungarica]